MSASKNPDSVASQEGEFHSRVPASGPAQQGGHKPGILASQADRAPTFSAETHPAGTAPKDATYEPNPDLNNQKMYQSASSTIQGSTSADVHTGLGHPGQGQTSKELHHDGQSGGKKQGSGLAGLAETGNAGVPVSGRDPAFKDQRALDKDVPRGERGTVGGLPAEERIPEGQQRTGGF